MTNKCGAKRSDGLLHICTLEKNHAGRHYCGNCWKVYKRRFYWKRVFRRVKMVRPVLEG